MTYEQHTPEVEKRARELYEASRKRVSGRPSWERLNPADNYDMGMKSHAYEMAKSKLAELTP